MLCLYEGLPLFCVSGFGGDNAALTEGCSCLVWNWKSWITLWVAVQNFPRTGPIPEMNRSRNEVGLLQLFPSPNSRLRNNKTCLVMISIITKWVISISLPTPCRDQAKRNKGFDLAVLSLTMQMHGKDREHLQLLRDKLVPDALPMGCT